jgi:DNA-binding response OmpR family regulator
VLVLIATDADWIVDEVTAALSGDDVTFVVCRDGRAVSDQVAERQPDLAVLDLQIGSMGGMAVTMALRLDESAGALPHVPVLMLLDRRADVHLARRSAAEGWLVKPLDALRIRHAAHAVLAGEGYAEGLDVAADPVESMIPAVTSSSDEPAGDVTEAEPANAG